MLRLRFAHKIATYTMAAAAVSALCLSGKLGMPVASLAVGGLVASWWWEEPHVRVRRWAPIWNLAGVVLFLAALLPLLEEGHLVLAIGRCLLVGMVVRLFTRSTLRDDQWIHILSLSLLVAAAGVNLGPSFALCFATYMVAAVMGRLLFQLCRESGGDGAPDGGERRPDLHVGSHIVAGAGALAMLVLVLALVLFVVLPRSHARFFFGVPGSSALSVGFSEQMALNDHGVLRDDPTVVMRVRVSDPRYRNPRAHPLYWRGRAFDHYRNGRWSRSDGAARVATFIERGRDVTRIQLGHRPRAAGERGESMLRQEIFLEPIGTDLLLGASRLRIFEIDHALAPRLLQSELGVGGEVRLARAGGVSYVVHSVPDSPARRSVAKRDFPRGDSRRGSAGRRVLRVLAAYRQIPAAFPRRVRQLAERIVRGEHDPMDKAVAIERYLQSRYEYTVDLRAFPAHEPIDGFLFERRAGHCEYFSSAMVMLLRSVGVPARNVTGFLGGDWNDYGDYITVRARHAHSWVEGWIPNRGWRTFDPTPAGGAGPGGFAEVRAGRLGHIVDSLRLAWLEWVIDYDLDSQVGLLGQVQVWLRQSGGQTRKWTDAIRAPGWAPQRIVVAAIGLAGLGLAAWLLLRRRTRSAARRRDGPAREPVSEIYEAVVRRLARHGFSKEIWQTPREYAVTLGKRSLPIAPPFIRLTELYYESRYGGSAGGMETVARAERLAEQVRRFLMGRK